jgi:hypothetical protein
MTPKIKILVASVYKCNEQDRYSGEGLLSYDDGCEIPQNSLGTLQTGNYLQYFSTALFAVPLQKP